MIDFIDNKLYFLLQFCCTCVIVYLCTFVFLYLNRLNPHCLPIIPVLLIRSSETKYYRRIYSALYMCHNRPAPWNSLRNSTEQGKNLKNSFGRLGRTLAQVWPKDLLKAVERRPLAGQASGVHHCTHEITFLVMAIIFYQIKWETLLTEINQSPVRYLELETNYF